MYVLGFDTTHKVNNVILKGTFGDKSYPKILPPKKEKCRYSFSSNSSRPEAS